MKIRYRSGAVRSFLRDVKSGSIKINPAALQLMRSAMLQDGVDPKDFLLCMVQDISNALITGSIVSECKEDYRDLFLTLIYSWLVACDEAEAKEFERWMSAPAYGEESHD